MVIQNIYTIHAQFYKHSDGYPEGLGLDIAEYIASKEDKCIFVGMPTQLINEYSQTKNES